MTRTHLRPLLRRIQKRKLKNKDNPNDCQRKTSARCLALALANVNKSPVVKMHPNALRNW